MKNYLLPALIWALAISHTIGQNHLAPSILAAKTNWPAPVKKLFAQAGFEHYYPAGVQARGPETAFQLDSTKNFVYYAAPGDSTPLTRTIYQYPQSNVRRELIATLDDAGWQNDHRSTFTEDGAQRLVQVLNETFDPVIQDYLPESKLVVFPRSNSSISVDSFFVYQWDPAAADWQELLSTRNTFNVQNRLKSSYTIIRYLGLPLAFQDVYDYDFSGDNYLIESFALIGNEVLEISKDEIAYADHLPIESIHFESDGLMFALQGRKTYTYTEFGALQQFNDYELNADQSDWILIQSATTNFDEQQQMISEETETFGTGTIDKSRSAYTYFAAHQLATETNFFWDANADDWTIHDRTHYYYEAVSAAHTPGLAQALALSPNPATGFVQLQLAESAVVQVINTAGQLIHTQILQPGQSLDLTGLSAGIYQVSAHCGAHWYSGKMAIDK